MSPDAEPLEPGAWARLAACTGAAALLQVDGTLITVALPSVAHGLKVSGASTSTVLSVYFAAYALTLWPAGALVDRAGPRRIALAGLALFALGAAGGAISSNIVVLLLTRVVQGAAAGLVSPAALAGAVSGFPPSRRGSALGIWGASAGVSNLLGPMLGGLLTVAFGWRADWWALVPLGLLAIWAIATQVPERLGDDFHVDSGGIRSILNETVLSAAGIAALTFAVMIGTFYLAEQYLQRGAGFSALGASSVLVLVALLVGAAAPVAGKLVDTKGERALAIAGFLGTATGLVVLGIGSVSLNSAVTVIPLIPIGLGLGLLFVPASRAALNATPQSQHGRTSAILSIGRLVGAGLGAGLAGVALSGGATASTVHSALLFAAGLCLFVGVPLATLLRAPRVVPAR
ncbi:MAG: MFS transporter [Solirubrobacteraceae bacterium]